MNETIKKIKSMAERMVNEKGSLTLFCLVSRVDLEGKWDIVVSGKWITADNTSEDMVYVVTLFKDEFGESLDFLAQILILTEDNGVVQTILTSVMKNSIEPSETPLFDFKLYEGFTLKNMYLIKSDTNQIIEMKSTSKIDTAESQASF